MSAIPILGDLAEFAKVISGALSFVQNQYALRNTPEMISNGQAAQVTEVADRVNRLINIVHDKKASPEARKKAFDELKALDS